MRGFEVYNRFKVAIRDLKQLYDITYHLYLTETINLENELQDISPRNNLNTSVGSIDHNIVSLYQRLQSSYPNKFRQLILISTITSLEVYLTDVILEVFQRDILPFKTIEPVTYQRNYIFSLGSIDTLKDQLVKKDFRNLTSGGLKEIVKYYIKTFQLDIKNLTVPFTEIEEIHVRRHLFVHRNGVVDNEYATKFPEFNFKIGDIITIDHEYLINSLNKISEFAGLINKEFIHKFPDIKRYPKYIIGESVNEPDQKKIMLEISLLSENFDHVDYFQTLNENGLYLNNIIDQIVNVDNTCYLFLKGTQRQITKFYKYFNNHKSFSVIRTIQLNQ